MRFANRGEPSLLVWRIASEFTIANSEVQAFCLPLMSREGGLLIAMPQNVLNDAALMSASMSEDDALLGPSREFQAEVVIENDDGAEVGTGERQDFLVIDVADEILISLREYDPVTDSLEDVVSFSQERPESLVAVGDVLPDVNSWLENIAGDQGRLNFYSAREEQELVSVPKKKANPKKVTTARLAEQMSAMMTQIQALAAVQENLSKGMAKDPAAGSAAGHPLGASAKLPALSASVEAASPVAVKKALSLVGPPPRTRLPVHGLGAPDAGGGHGNRFGNTRRRSTGSHCSDIAAVRCSHKPRRTPDIRGCSDRPPGEHFFLLREHKRSCQKGENATRLGGSNQSILLAGQPADLQKDASFESLPQDGGGAPEKQRVDDHLPRKVRGLSRPEGEWTCHVDGGTCNGCSSPRGFLCHEGVSSTTLCSTRPGHFRRKLASCLHSRVVGGATTTNVRREDAEFSVAGEAVCPSDTSIMGSGKPFLCKGNRLAIVKEGRDQTEDGPTESRRSRRRPITKETAEVPEASQARGRSQRCLIRDGSGELGLCSGSPPNVVHAEDCPEVSQPLSSNLSKNRKTKKLGKMGPYVTNQNASLLSGTQKAPGVSNSKHQKLSSSDRLSSGPYPGLGSLGSGCNPQMDLLQNHLKPRTTKQSFPRFSRCRSLCGVPC